MSSDSRQDAYEGTKPVAEAVKFDEARLAKYLSDNIDGFAGPAHVDD